MPPIVFDLDGTLIDSLPAIHAALNLALAEVDSTPVTSAQTRSFIGNGMPHLVSLARAEKGIADSRQDELTAITLRHYLAVPPELTRCFPGVIAALAALRANGHQLGLCTNKPLVATQAVLAEMDLAQHFQVVIAGDSLPQRKPDAAPLHAAFAALGAPGLFVGDSEVDCATAAAAGVPFALFTEGYRHTPPEGLPHRLLFSDFAALPGLVATL